jgi:regulator of sirC expression with transglutaminase-like and TPR domain
MKTDRTEKTDRGQMPHKVPVSFVVLSMWVAVTILLLSHSFAADFVNDVDKLLALPERKIDVGIAALTLAKEVYPNLDVKAYSAKIDKMAEETGIFAKGRTDPDYRIRALNTYLYKSVGLQYDLSDPYVEKPENRYLNGILDTKKGSCVTMPLLYLAIAQRLGYPVYFSDIPILLLNRKTLKQPGAAVTYQTQNIPLCFKSPKRA